MPEILELTDRTLEDVLTGKTPALILFSNGEGIRGDFNAAFKQAAEKYKRLTFARINVREHPQAGERFSANGKPVLIGWFNQEEVLRRPRPWGSDVPLAVEMLEKALAENPAASEAVLNNKNEPVDAAAVAEKVPVVMDTQPVIVTDATFQEEVIDYDLPVLVDFWAPWCGPCRQVAPVLEKLAKEYAGKIRVAKVNVDENPMLSQTFRIMSIPTIMMIKQRTIVFSQPGAFPEAAFRDLIDQLIGLEIPPHTEEEHEDEEEPAQ